MVLIKSRAVQQRAARSLATRAELYGRFDTIQSDKLGAPSYINPGASRRDHTINHNGAVSPEAASFVASRWGSGYAPSELIPDEASEPSIQLNRSPPISYLRPSSSLLSMLSNQSATKRVAAAIGGCDEELSGTPLVGPSIPSATAGLDGKSTKFSMVRLRQRSSSYISGPRPSLFEARGDTIPRLSPLLTGTGEAHRDRCGGALASHSHKPSTTWRPFHTSICAFSKPDGPANKSRGENLLLGRHVREALANGEPVVALESTLITHGLPEPDNFDLALKLEHIIASSAGSYDDDDQLAEERLCVGDDKERNDDNKTPADSIGAILGGEQRRALVRSKPMPIVTPSTIGIVKGQLIIGLSQPEIAYLANKRLSGPIKASRRDVPIATAMGLSAGTTVAATMAIACNLPGSPIKVFATGGTGGVHMGGELSMDVSADLYELARSPMGVVSSGFKWFLDTRRSLELLETFGCTVMSLAGANNQAKEHLFPGFFASTNQQKVRTPLLVRSVGEAAKILYHCLEATPLRERRGALLAVPIPREFELDGDLEILSDDGISAIDKRLDVEGKAKTPLILERLNRVTGGKTLRANLELLKNNAKVGAQLALCYAKLRNRTGKLERPSLSGGQLGPLQFRQWPAKRGRSRSQVVTRAGIWRVLCFTHSKHLMIGRLARFRQTAHSIS